MSAQALVKFWRSVEGNPALRQQVDQLGPFVPDDPDEAFAPLSRLANDAGFDCSPGDLRSGLAVSRFWNALDQRQDLLEEMAHADGLEPPAAIAIVHGVATKAGCRCSVEDFDVFSRALIGAQRSRELTDDELDTVAGATYTQTPAPLEALLPALGGSYSAAANYSPLSNSYNLTSYNRTGWGKYY